ncbi:MAG: adenosylcobinamide-GDP ribazoletransferase [Candidatus Syntropharchaeales archaeon]
MRLIKGIKDVIGFFTIIPIKNGDFEGAADHAYLLPVLGALIAVICSLFAVLSFYLFPPLVTGMLVFLVALIITGFNNIDGLADVADGMMVHGDAMRKRSAMKDTRLGISGLVSCIFLIGLDVAAFSELALLGLSIFIKSILLSEVGSKYAMLLISYLGTPSHEGLGSVFLERIGNFQIAAGSILTILLVLLVSFAGQIALAVLLVIPVVLILTLIARRSFGGVSGDVIGACGEISRVAILLGLLAIC